MAKTIELKVPVEKWTFNNYPNLKTVYLGNYAIKPDTIPNRRLVLFFPKDYSHKIENVPENAIVVVHADSVVVDGLFQFPGRSRFFVWRDDSFWPYGEGVFGFHLRSSPLVTSMKGFQDPEYDTKKNWIIGVGFVDLHGYAPLSIKRFSDYWIDERVINNVFASMNIRVLDDPNHREINTSVDDLPSISSLNEEIKRNHKKLKTDGNADYLLDYFCKEDVMFSDGVEKRDNPISMFVSVDNSIEEEIHDAHTSEELIRNRRSESPIHRELDTSIDENTDGLLDYFCKEATKNDKAITNDIKPVLTTDMINNMFRKAEKRQEKIRKNTRKLAVQLMKAIKRVIKNGNIDREWLMSPRGIKQYDYDLLVTLLPGLELTKDGDCIRATARN